MWNELTFLWNELTILWNDLTIDWNDLTWNDLTMERNDRNSSKRAHIHPTGISQVVTFHRRHWQVSYPGLSHALDILESL